MKVQVDQIPVKGLVERLNQQVGKVGQAKWDLTGHGHQIPEPRHVGPPWSNQNHSVARAVHQLLHHFAQDGYWWEGIRVQIFP